jgi:Predicted membrane protein (DUF2127)
MQDGGRWRRLIYRRIAAFVIASAHIAVSRHLLATFHLGRRHGRIGQARQQRTASPQQNKKQRSDAPNAHITMLRRSANHTKQKNPEPNSSPLVPPQALIPLEIYELVHHPTFRRALLLLVNLAVVAYLIFEIRRLTRTKHATTT